MLHDTRTTTLKDTNELAIKKAKNPGKETSTKIVMINGEIRCTFYELRFPHQWQIQGILISYIKKKK